MKVTGKRVVGRPREELYRLLLEPTVLRDCIPGCESVERLDSTHYDVRVRVRLGLVRGRFRGQVSLIGLEPPEEYKFEVEGSGPGGRLVGATSVRLDGLDGGARTEVSYEAHARAKGVIGRLGSSFLGRAARRFADQFFDALEAGRW